MSNDNLNSQCGSECALAALSHLLALISNGLLLGFVWPLIFMYMSGDSQFVMNHAKESLNFQISLIVYAIISIVLCFVFIGIPMLVVLAIAAIVLPIIATVRATNGDPYRYPLIFRLIK